jgi:hypothetical protein
MRITMIASLLIVAAGGAPAWTQESYELPQTVVPVPLASVHAPSGPLFSLGSRLGLGWLRMDGSSLEGFISSQRGLPGFLYRAALLETESFRQQVVAGTEVGIANDWYLGNGLSATLDVGASVIPARRAPVYLCLGFAWYPLEGLQLNVSYDLFWGLDTVWTFRP